MVELSWSDARRLRIHSRRDWAQNAPTDVAVGGSRRRRGPGAGPPRLVAGSGHSFGRTDSLRCRPGPKRRAVGGSLLVHARDAAPGAGRRLSLDARSTRRSDGRQSPQTSSRSRHQSRRPRPSPRGSSGTTWQSEGPSSEPKSPMCSPPPASQQRARRPDTSCAPPQCSEFSASAPTRMAKSPTS